MNIIKILAASFAMSMAVATASAAEPVQSGYGEGSDVENVSVRDKWFINVAAGPQILFSDHDKQASLGDRISPALDIAVGKWFQSGFGVRLMYSGLKAKGATQSGVYATDEYLGNNHGWTHKQEFNFCNIHADVMFNMSKLIDDTNMNRIWACSPYLGVGIAHIYDSPKKNCASFNIGIYNAIRIYKGLDATVDMRGMFVGDGFDGEKGERKGEGILSLSLGLAYNF